MLAPLPIKGPEPTLRQLAAAHMQVQELLTALGQQVTSLQDDSRINHVASIGRTQALAGLLSNLEGAMTELKTKVNK